MLLRENVIFVDIQSGCFGTPSSIMICYGNHIDSSPFHMLLLSLSLLL